MAALDESFDTFLKSLPVAHPACFIFNPANRIAYEAFEAGWLAARGERYIGVFVERENAAEASHD